MAPRKSGGGRESPGGTEDEYTDADKPFSKEYRIRLAKAVVYREIPRVLEGNPRGWAALRNSRLWHGETDLPSIAAMGSKSTITQHEAADPEASNPQSTAAPSASGSGLTLKVKIRAGDTFDVAHSYRERGPDTKIAVLNLASSSQPGGGLFSGSKAQEEALCMRSTLWATLKKVWYPWSEDAVAWADDIVVFGELMTNGGVRRLDPDKRWYVDVVSAAAVRRPKLKKERTEYKYPKDEQDMTLKIKYIMRLCAKKGAKVVVLGALGCGSFGNPSGKVARMFKECLLGVEGGKPEEDWAAAGIEEVVFAIFDNTRARAVWKGFVGEFGQVDGVVIEE